MGLKNFDRIDLVSRIAPLGVSGDRRLELAASARSERGGLVGIGEGDEDWPEVLEALAEVGYQGFAAAEVGGGGGEVLKDISERMERVLGLAG